MLTLSNISYTLPQGSLLFSNIDFTINKHNKIALIGNNGVGKSSLLKIIIKELQPTTGLVEMGAIPYYIPQIYGQFNHLTIAEALGISKKLTALHSILAGDVSIENMDILQDDWTIEERCQEALGYWELNGIDVNQYIATLSGGQKVKVFLTGISLHHPDLIIMDEPSNHLDGAGRQKLYDFIQHTNKTLLIISHDRELLRLVDSIYEMSPHKVTTYGGNYDFYTEQKQIETKSLHHHILSKEKDLKKAKEKEREAIERTHKLDSRGKKKQEKAGVARIMMNTMRNNAELSTSKLKGVHAGKIGEISDQLQELRSTLPEIDKMKFGLDNSSLHHGKILFKLEQLNFHYTTNPNVWPKNLNILIRSGERIALQGNNGSGKTTLIQLLLGVLKPTVGQLIQVDQKSIYIDQQYSLIDNTLNVYTQAQRYNDSSLLEHEVKARLNRFLFTKTDWDKACDMLSGGERMRLSLCCLTISDQNPDIIILDEPTNNLDIQNIEILTAAINEYQGTLIVVSHDKEFLQQIGISRYIDL